MRGALWVPLYAVLNQATAVDDAVHKYLENLGRERHFSKNGLGFPAMETLQTFEPVI